MPIVILIMLDVHTLEDPLLDGVCSMSLHSFNGKARNRIEFPSPQLNLNTELCLKPAQRYFGYMGFFMSLVSRRIHQLLFMWTILVHLSMLIYLFYIFVIVSSTKKKILFLSLQFQYDIKII